MRTGVIAEFSYLPIRAWKQKNNIKTTSQRKNERKNEKKGKKEKKPLVKPIMTGSVCVYI